MEDRVFVWLCQRVDRLPEPSTRVRYPLTLILRMVLWAVLNDRPLCWACDAAHWPAARRPASLPNQSTLSRRVNRFEFMHALDQLHRRVRRQLGPFLRDAAMDGRPLPVGGSSQDREAKPGRAVRGMGRGYKLFAVADMHQAILAFQVHAMNTAEPTVARMLVTQLPRSITRLVGDTIYDSMPLHRAADACGCKVYTPLRQKRVGRRRQRRRVQLLRLWQRGIGQRYLRTRDTIERAFARLSGIGFGFKGLPPWVRGLTRVRIWMACKILLYNAYLALRRMNQHLEDA